jgi:hypothetical protein
MKTLLATAAAIALIAAPAPVSAQMYQTTPQLMSMTPTWMMDDGSSSDHPIHNPDDFSASQLNSQYINGIYTAPGTGLPAYPYQR